jgi:long-chain fatty acid transport protein
MVGLPLSRSVAVGFGPILTLGQVAAEPFVFASPNSDGRYSPARSTHYRWGGGAQLGVYYAVGSFRLGAALKTPAWMETFEFYGEDAAGDPRVLHLDLDLPAIVSAGLAYVRPETWGIAVDVRYFDYGHADGFEGPAAFDATGALSGLGWRGIVSAGAGVQRRLSPSVSVRAGYAYNENPVPSENSFFNLASPLIYQHTMSAGLSVDVAHQSSVSLAYSYFLPEEVSGPIVSPLSGPVPGSLVRNTLDVHVVSVGVSTRY